MILGITGTIGAGKGAAVDHLIKTHGFTHYSVRDVLVEEISSRGLPQTRDTMKAVADELRAKHSPSYIIEELYAKAHAHGGDVVIESVRTLDEARFLKKHSAIILAVDADRRLRYERITARGLSTDHVSFEEFCRQEDAELSNTDPNQQNILGVMALADYRINNETSLEELHTRIEEMLEAVAKKHVSTDDA